ncbi:MAG: general secretion pathway protein GspB [Rhodanobacteraceae bacterium]|nr:general secretion pathway protein GspB [Rhodanobacteraceae bacterium]
MSLILDALKKSEAERRRGLPPTLHMPYATPRRARRAPWAAGAGAVLLAAGLAGGWMWMGRGRDAGDVDAGALPPLAGVPTAAPGDPSTAPTLPASAEPMLAAADAAVPEAPADFAGTPTNSLGGVSGRDGGVSVSGGGLPVPQRAALFTPSAVPIAPPTTVAADPVTPTVTPPEPPAPPVSAPVVAEAGDQAAGEKPQTVDPAPPAAAGTDASPMEITAPEVAMVDPQVLAPAKPEEKLPDIYQLPYATRKELPKLNLTMHVYSPIAEERFIVLNGKRYTVQSPAPGPELSLLDIVADGAVLEFRGQRFLLPRQTF